MLNLRTFVFVTSALVSSLTARVSVAQGPGGGEAEGLGSDWIFSVVGQQQEVFVAGVEAWSPFVAKSGYFGTARVGLAFALRAHDEIEVGDHEELNRVNANDYSLGYSVDSRHAEFLRLRSVFLVGYAAVDRHSEVTSHPDGRDPTSYGFFDMRQGFGLVPPTHEAHRAASPTSAETGSPSLLEVGLGVRWAFIGGRILHAGDQRVREIQVYPYLAANMFI